LKDLTKNTGVIILAAGESSRLGRPKQLLEFQNQTLIEKITGTALTAGLKTVVVLGAKWEKIKPVIENLPVETVLNKNWKKGISYSIATGLEKLLEINRNLSAVIILLVDQPFISPETIFKLIKTQKETGKKIVAAEYEDTVGVPALFDQGVFGELLNLNETGGAKSIIKKYLPKDVAKISVPEARFDIDTEEDYRKIK
jgi:molybdenum cofactor cytidylyltransferase